ncbi:MAG: hypothetical protein H7138_16910 [Myxococcales bacterium]|nr:hypothetical protein [Myxococcales bacterium]
MATSFGPYAGLDEDAVAVLLHIGDDLSAAAVTQVHAAPDGTVWVRRGASLEHRAATGERIAAKDLTSVSENQLVAPDEIVFHADGEITAVTLLVVARADGRPVFAAELRRLSHDLRDLRRVLVQGEATLTLPERHIVAEDGSFTTEPGETLSQPGFAPRRFVADADGGLYAIERGRLVHLDARYAVVAATWLSPDLELPIKRYVTIINERGETIQIPIRHQLMSGDLVVDQAQRIWAAFAAPSFASPALTQHYGAPVELGDDGDLFVVRFSPALVPERVVSLPAPNVQDQVPYLAKSAAGTIGVTSWSTERRDIEPNKTFNGNVAFAVVDADGQRLANGDLDLARDDQPIALAPCADGFCIGGITDTKWVDTGSQVDFGKGFILQMTADGQRDRLWTLHGPRNNEVRSLAGSLDGVVFFSATTNGPITHTDPAEGSRELILGKLQL